MVGTKTRESSILIQILSPVDSQWQKTLDDIPHDFYHLPGYLALEAKRYHSIPEAIIIKDESSVFFLPYLLRDCSHLLNSKDGESDLIYDVISPYGYPGILLNQAGQNPEFIKRCLELTYNCWQDRNICSAFIRMHPFFSSYINDFNFDKSNFILQNQGNIVVCDLTKDVDYIWNQMRPKHRTKLRQISRSSLTVRMVSGDEYLDIFIDIYRETMDRVNAGVAYYFSQDYFHSLFKILRDRINICIVEIDGEIIAASLITEFNGIVQYYLSGSKTIFSQQSPTMMMIKYVIEWAKIRDNKYFNLGGGLGGKRDSLYYFKSGFSDEVKLFTTIKTIVHQEKYSQLVDARSKSLGITPTELEDTSFFPAYRSC